MIFIGNVARSEEEIVLGEHKKCTKGNKLFARGIDQ